MQFAGGKQELHGLSSAQTGDDAIRVQIRLQRLRYQNTSVRLLVSFDQRDEQSSQGGPASVEDMRQPVLAAFRLVTEVHSSRLKILAVRTAGHFQVGPLPWCPDFDVISHRAGETHVAGAKLNDLVME